LACDPGLPALCLAQGHDCRLASDGEVAADAVRLLTRPAGQSASVPRVAAGAIALAARHLDALSDVVPDHAMDEVVAAERGGARLAQWVPLELQVALPAAPPGRLSKPRGPPQAPRVFLPLARGLLEVSRSLP
jgi:hypothetical protein